MDYGAGTDGGHGRSLCQRCATGTHSRHRSGSDRLESILSEYANIAYWGIVALLMIRLIMQLAGIIRLTCRCRKIQIGNTSIHLLPKADGPFSFFHWIFIHPSSHTEEEFNEILTHEQTHARQWHSIDVIISELVCIFCWCNPFAWLMKREIRTNLEYMADARVLENGYDSKNLPVPFVRIVTSKGCSNYL